MAASMTKHAGCLAGRQFRLINRIHHTTTCQQHVFLSRGTPGFRNSHRSTSDTIAELQKNQGTSDIPSTAKQNRYSGQAQGHGSTQPLESDEMGKDHLPTRLSNMRKNLCELHKLSGYDRLDPINWENEYDEPQYTSTTHYDYVPRKDNTTEMSSTTEDDFFGVYEEVNSKHIESNSASGKHAAHSEPGKIGKRKSHPTKTFENILRNKVSPTEVETVVELPYGIMRRDQDNIVKSHGRVHAVPRRSMDPRPSQNIDAQLEIDSQFEPAKQIQANYFDEQYFEPSISEEQQSLSKGMTYDRYKGEQVSIETHMHDQGDYIEEQYFAKEHVTEDEHSRPLPQSDLNDTGYSFIENQYIGTVSDASLHPTPDRGADLGRFSDFVQDETESEPLTASFQQPKVKRERGTIQKNSSRSKSRDIPLQNSIDIPPQYDKGHSLSETSSTNLFDEQYFTEGMKGNVSEDMVTTTASTGNVIEDQYSGKLSGDPMMSRSEINVSSNQANEYLPRNMQLSKVSPKNEISGHQYAPKSSPNKPRERVKQRDLEDVYMDKSAKAENVYDMSQKFKKESDETLPNHDPDFGSNAIHVGGLTKQQRRVQNKIKPNVDNPETAYDLAMKIRLEKEGRIRPDDAYIAPNAHKWSGSVDSKGFRKLKDQVPDIQRMPQEVVVSILRDSILYEADEFIAIDKPYGLPSHGGPGIHHSIGKLMHQLAEKVGAKELGLVHRLDKETTGVMLLAKTTNMGVKLRRMFKEREVIKRYWVITKGIPSPLRGTIDIPMVEDEVGGRYRMNVQPYKTEQTNVLIRKQQLDLPRKDAVTSYKVLDSNHGAALVECEPETGVKHQIRCHLAFGINTPVLGDHKYSHYTKMAPQRLSPEMLQRLGLRQALVRYVPMHLHAKALVLPQLGSDGRNIFISCRLPKHFVQNMAWLKLKPPKGV